MRWGVVSTVCEPAPLVMAFVAHYLELGASRIDLFLDAPDPALAALLAPLERVHVTQQTARDWRQAGHALPPSPPQRQRINARRVYEAGRVDWLLHVDADEFLTDAALVLRDVAAMPDEVDYVGLWPLERVRDRDRPESTLFEGAFRRLVTAERQAAVAPVYGDALRFLDWGLSSNGRIKAFVRSGRALDIDLHEPARRDGGAAVGWLIEAPVLLHFDGMTEANYTGKLVRKIAQNAGWRAFPAPGRRAQLAEVAAARGDPTRISALYRSVKTVDPEQAAALEVQGLLMRVPFDPRTAVAKTFPGISVDFRCAGFDATPMPQMHLNAATRIANDLRGRLFQLRRHLRRRLGG